MEFVFDKLRKANVPLTPEEQVRQWFISVLENHCKVPVSHMLSEWEFTFNDKTYRADIAIWNAAGRVSAVVECKRPEVAIDAKVFDQAKCYDVALDLTWIILTNGKKTVVMMKKEGQTFIPSDKLPDYEEL